MNRAVPTRILLARPAESTASGRPQQHVPLTDVDRRAWLLFDYATCRYQHEQPSSLVRPFEMAANRRTTPHRGRACLRRFRLSLTLVLDERVGLLKWSMRMSWRFRAFTSAQKH